MGLLMWSFGTFWLFHAVTSVLYRARSMKFSLGCFGFIFSGGTYTTATISLGREIPSAFFSYLSVIFTVVIVVLWILVSSITLYKAYTRTIFVAPCLADVLHQQQVANNNAIANGRDAVALHNLDNITDKADDVPK